MQVLVANPNSTASMTRKIEAAARAVAFPGTEIIAVNPSSSPPSIQGFVDAAACVPPLIALVQGNRNVDAVVIACFDDTGLDAIRCVADCPVVGIGEAAFHAASLISTKFSVVTTLRRSVPGIECNLHRYGLDRRCANVRASDIPVLKLEAGDPETLGIIKREIRASIEVDHAEAVVLGCAGMADLASDLSAEFGIPVIDGVAVAVTLAEALVRAGLRTSKIGAYSATD